MAQDFTLSGYTSWDMPVYMHRTNPVPLDSSSLFASYSDAVDYAANNAVSYVGQIVTVVSGQNVTPYQIQADGTLSELASADASTTSSVTNPEIEKIFTVGDDLNVFGTITTAP